MTIEQELIEELKGNEQVIQVVSASDLFMEHEEVISKVKLAAGYVAPVMDLNIAQKLVRDFGINADKLVLKSYAGKQYVIFKGPPGQRTFLRGTRYLASNPKVVRMAVGPKGVLKSVKGGFVITAVLSVGIEVFRFVMDDTATLYELLGNVTSELIKIGLSSLAGAAAGIAAGGVAVLAGVAAAPLIAAVAVGVVTGLVLNELDKRFGVTLAIISAYEQMGVNLKQTRDGFTALKYEINRQLYFLERNPQYIPCLFGHCGYRGGY